MRAFRQLLMLAALVGLLVAPALLLTGCASVPKADAPPPPAKFVPVDREVRRACIDPAQVPVVPPKGLAIPADARQAALVLAARVDQLWAIVDRWAALSVGCVG